MCLLMINLMAFILEMVWPAIAVDNVTACAWCSGSKTGQQTTYWVLLRQVHVRIQWNLQLAACMHAICPIPWQLNYHTPVFNSIGHHAWFAMQYGGVQNFEAIYIPIGKGLGVYYMYVTTPN